MASARLEVVTHAIQCLHSWHATPDRTSQVDLLRVWHNRVGFRSKTRAKFNNNNIYLKSNIQCITVPIWRRCPGSYGKTRYRYQHQSSVTLFTPDPAQANTRPKIKIADSDLPFVRSPKILGVYLDTYNWCLPMPSRHCFFLTLLATCKQWLMKKSETEMLQVEDHLNLLSAQYMVQCIDTENVCHHIIKMDLPPREMKETIFPGHNNQTALPLLADNRKDTFYLSIQQ